jgi:hypothetical protein
MSTLLRDKAKFGRGFVPTSALAKSVAFDSDTMIVRLIDGRALSVPLQWFPTLQNATPAQRENWEIGGGGIGLHWPELDEDLSVANLMAGVDWQST